MSTTTADFETCQSYDMLAAIDAHEGERCGELATEERCGFALCSSCADAHDVILEIAQAVLRENAP